MGRGVSAGGGQSSLGYLFGSGEATNAPQAAQNGATRATNSDPSPGTTTVTQPAEVAKQIPAGIQSNHANNHLRADGQNCGNFITERPSTKVHAAPGGGSSLDYLFGGGSK